MREVLYIILKRPEEERIRKVGWDIMENSFEDYIAELENHEPRILFDTQHRRGLKEMK